VIFFRSKRIEGSPLDPGLTRADPEDVRGPSATGDPAHGPIGSPIAVRK
jgi:hypothetical protein